MFLSDSSGRQPGRLAIITLLGTILGPLWAIARPAEPPEDSSSRVDYNRDVRPILSDNCFKCHGPDEAERKAKLRFDKKEGALGKLASGGFAIVPGKSAESLVWKKITAPDPGDRMPPPETGKKLSPTQIERIRRWIDQGAEWSAHWSFVPPRKPSVPESSQAAGVGVGVEEARSPVDHFIRARLEREGLKPSPPADPVTLLRRVTLDLTGLSPEPREVDEFLAEASPNAYEALVDRLLASPRYGEHMARYWLDAARYGDTHGLHFDNERSLWPYRDWVIRAFNRNMPFDAFTVEQLAGDLLPDATRESRVATGFNRCNVSTSEGGSIDEEVLVRYAVDRVETTATVWLGLTTGCAVCHDHKFDPITQRELYQLYAFFNSLEENAMDGNAALPPPSLKVPTPEHETALASLGKEIDDLKKRLDAPMPESDAAQAAWQKALAEKLKGLWRILEPAQVASTGGAALRKLEDGSFLAEGPSPDKDVYEVAVRPGKTVITAIRLEALRHESLPGGGAGRADNSNFVLSEIEATVAFPDTAGAAQRPSQRVAFLSAQADYSQQGFEIQKAVDGKLETGWAVDGPTRKEDRTAVFIPAQPIALEEGAELRLRLVQENGGKHAIGRFRLSVSSDAGIAPLVLGPWKLLGPFPAGTGGEAFNTDYGPEAKLDLAASYLDGKLKWIDRLDFADGKVHELAGETAATYLHRKITTPAARALAVSLGSDDGIKVWLDGKLLLARNEQRGVAPDQERLALDLSPGEHDLLLKVNNWLGGYGFYFKRLDDDGPNALLDLGPVLSAAPEKRSEAERKRLRDYYRSNHSPEWKSLKARASELELKSRELDAQIPATLVTKEMEKRRDAFVLIRGDYTRKAEKVEPGVPAVLPPLPEDAPRNRLGLARWLVQPGHPLTARVTVNRFWQQYFGTGIVKTAVDFGSQGEWPVHPELLDWLAVDFVESRWNVKRLQKLIVTSAAYRQASRVTPEAFEKDPENRLLSRGPRFRMDAEVVRDSALFASGLLVEKIGGPSVKPYQPPGLWEAVGFVGSNTSIFKPDQGDALYRRGIYTFWKRTSPPPVMSLFDAPSRETCTMLRPRTNTPLQALAMMNDVQYFEAARRLAERMMREGGEESAARIAHAFRLATARRPCDDELKELVAVYGDHLKEFQGDVGAATRIVSAGESPRDAALDVSVLAACTMVASLILNLDETLTKG